MSTDTAHNTSLSSAFPGLTTRRGPKAPLRAMWALNKAPAMRNRFTVVEGIRVPMRDGVTLEADLFVPDGQAPARTLLMQTPYPRSGIYSMEADFFAARGFTVLFVSARGQQGSDGTFVPMSGHGPDGADVVAWMREQSWFDGKFATVGSSYGGYTQWALLDSVRPPELIGMSVGCGPHDFAGNAVGAGPYRVFDYMGWSRTVSGGMKGRKAFEKRLYAFFNEHKKGVPPEMQARAPWTLEWAVHPNVEDPYWADYRHRGALEKVDVPVYVTNGWNDIFLADTFEQWRRFAERGVPVTAQLGPFGHNGEFTALLGSLQAPLISWLDDVFDGTPLAHPERYPSRVRVDKKTWIEMASWPPAATVDEFIPSERGQLLTASATSSGSATFTTSQASPTPAVGGGYLALGIGGRRDNRQLEARADVLTFTTDAFPTDYIIAGDPVVKLSVATDSTSIDLFAAITDVDRKGRSWTVTDGIVRVTDIDVSGPVEVTIPLTSVAHRLPAGHRLRLQISGGAFPRFDLNPMLLASGESKVQVSLDGTSSVHIPHL